MQRAKPDFLRRRLLQPRIGMQHVQNFAGRIVVIRNPGQQRSADDPFVLPPAGEFAEFPAGFTGHAEVELANQAEFPVQVIVGQGSHDCLAQSQGQRHQIRQGQPDLQAASVLFQCSPHAHLPTPFNAGQVLVQVHSGHQRNRRGVGDLPAQQRRQTVTAGEAVQKSYAFRPCAAC